MANICYLRITAVGPQKAVRALQEALTASIQPTPVPGSFTLSFNTWSCDKGFIRFDADHGDTFPLVESGQLSIKCCSHWVPPEDGIVAISLAYPECEFTVDYEISGVDVGGVLQVKSGKISHLRARKGHYHALLDPAGQHAAYRPVHHWTFLCDNSDVKSAVVAAGLTVVGPHSPHDEELTVSDGPAVEALVAARWLEID